MAAPVPPQAGRRGEGSMPRGGAQEEAAEGPPGPACAWDGTAGPPSTPRWRGQPAARSRQGGWAPTGDAAAAPPPAPSGKGGENPGSARPTPPAAPGPPRPVFATCPGAGHRRRCPRGVTPGGMKGLRP